VQLGDSAFAVPAAMQPRFDPVTTVRTEAHPGRNPLYDYCQRAGDAPASVTGVAVTGSRLQSAPQPVHSVHLIHLSLATGPLRLIPGVDFGPRLFGEPTLIERVGSRPEPGKPSFGWYRVRGRTEDGLAVMFDIDRHVPPEQWDATFRQVEAFITWLRRQ
jgi:hypothetical protein